jgi:hypothetical protein
MAYFSDSLMAYIFRVFRGRIQRKTWCMGPMPELTITSPYVHSRVGSNTFFMGNPMPESTSTVYAKVDFIPPSQGLRIWPQIKIPLFYSTFPASTISIKFPQNENRICYAKNLLIYLLVLSCNVFHPNFGFLLQCLLLIPQNRTAVQ